MRDQGGTVDVLIARLAFSAFGLVKRRQLLKADVSKKEIEMRLARGSLFIEYPGVYRVGHRAPSIEASYLAAVWACGDDAYLLGSAGAHLLGLLKGKPPPPEVMAPTKRSIEGIITSRYRTLHRGEVMKWRGIPVTTAARTLVDLAPVLSLDELARACHEAGVRYRTTPTQVEAVLKRRRTAPGAAKLRAVMSGDARVLLSKLETAFIALLRDDDLPLPQTNRPAGGYRVDCRWPDHQLTVELDSFRYHNSRHSWEQDRQREREARCRGDEFRRYTWADVFEDPAFMRADLRALLR
jgi:very-short-patch-repair endonuclease